MIPLGKVENSVKWLSNTNLDIMEFMIGSNFPSSLSSQTGKDDGKKSGGRNSEQGVIGK